MNVADMRKDYTQHGLLEAEAADEPFAQFSRWFDQAVVAQIHEPNAMTVATVDGAGGPRLGLCCSRATTRADLRFIPITKAAKDKRWRPILMRR